MQKLFDRVLAWGEKLVYSGTKDDGLPPDVMKALDEYLAESNSKLLVVLPLRDEREKENKKRPRAALMMECFEPQQTPEQLVARLEVVGKHATAALYNAVEHRRIPMRFLWMPLAKVQEGLGGKARAITFAIIAGVLALFAVLYFVPYQLKMDAQGKLLPEERLYIFSPRKGEVMDVPIQPGAQVEPNRTLVKIYDPDLFKELTELDKDIETSTRELEEVERQLNNAAGLAADVASDLRIKQINLNATENGKLRLRNRILRANNCVPNADGYFWVNAPEFPDVRRPDADKDPKWTVLTPDFRENLKRRLVDPKDPLLRLGNKEGRWEVEASIPQKHIGQVLYAFQFNNTDELDVDLIVRSDPTHTYRGKLQKSKIADQADPHKDDNNETEPVVLAWVRIEGDDIPADKRVPRDLALTGTEVKVKVLCGHHKMGYSLLYGVWEFFYEKVVFFF